MHVFFHRVNMSWSILIFLFSRKMALKEFAILLLQIFVLRFQDFIVLRCNKLVLSKKLLIEMFSEMWFRWIIFFGIGLLATGVCLPKVIATQLLLKVLNEHLLLQHSLLVSIQLDLKCQIFLNQQFAFDIDILKRMFEAPLFFYLFLEHHILLDQLLVLKS